jgi:type II secretory pathway predicted ATPase ExeA
MLPEYLKYWGLERPPFSLTPDPEMLYMSKQHLEGLLRLKYAVVSNKGGALLVSENAGDGKTSLLAKLRQELGRYYQGRCRVVFIDHPTLTANQMVGEIARQLGIRSNTTDKLTLLNELRQFLLDSHNQNVKCVVILDEGQMLCHRPDLLQELRILLNFCISDAFLLTFILSGQKPLEEAIRAMPEFYQRLPVRFFLKNLTREDTRELIRHRLHVAGNSAEREIFSEDGYTGIFNYSKGCPRVICSVADLSLVIAHSRDSRQVDFVSVSQACSDMSRTDGGYHYYYFLKSFNGEQAPDQDVPETQRNTFCPGCGAEVLAGSVFCPGCGCRLDAAPEMPARPEPAQSPDERAPQMFASAAESEPRAEKPAPGEPGEDLGKSGAAAPWLRFEIVEHADPEIPSGPEPAPVEPEAEETAEDAFSLEKKLPGDQVKCSFCGLVVSRTEAACPNCGENLHETAEEEPGVPAEPSPADLVPAHVDPPPEAPAVPAEDNRNEPVAEAPAEPGPQELRTCPACAFTGPAGEAERCSRCGSPLAEESLELSLLEDVSALSLRKLILNRSYLDSGRPPDPLGDELLFIPPGRFWTRSAVVQYSNGSKENTFTTRCGLLLSTGRLRFIFSDQIQDLDLRTIRQVAVEELEKYGLKVLYRLRLETGSGGYRIAFPFRSPVARRFTLSMAEYLTAKIQALACIAGMEP